MYVELCVCVCRVIYIYMCVCVDNKNSFIGSYIDIQSILKVALSASLSDLKKWDHAIFKLDISYRLNIYIKSVKG